MASPSTLPLVMSNNFAWNLMRRERAFDPDDFVAYDIQQAKHLIVQFPRPVELIDLERYGQLFRDSLKSVRLVDQPDNVDTSLPVILGRKPGGRKFLLDGWHRMARALESNLTHLPAVLLTEEETATAKVS